MLKNTISDCWSRPFYEKIVPSIDIVNKEYETLLMLVCKVTNWTSIFECEWIMCYNNLWIDMHTWSEDNVWLDFYVLKLCILIPSQKLFGS